MAKSRTSSAIEKVENREIDRNRKTDAGAKMAKIDEIEKRR